MGGTPPRVPAAAAALFSEAVLRGLESYADLLADQGVTRGLIGPREAPRLWERHLLNCAVIEPLFAPGSSVCDVGSGAGLPGVVLALCRPDLRVTLVEPLLRRTVFLEEAVAVLGIGNVEVLRGRADDVPRNRTFDAVTSRAVAPLDRLVGWCLPLVSRRGAMHAMKGSRAADEVREAEPMLRRAGCWPASVSMWGDGVVLPQTAVVTVARVAEGVLGWVAGQVDPQ